MSVKKIITILCFGCGIGFPSFSQTFTWKSGYDFIGDNREYYSSFGFPQTILASRISQEIGFNIDSTQKIMTGCSYLITHGAKQFEQQPVLTMYYEYSHKNINAQVGSFPMKEQLFPLALYTDSLNYYKPNTQGIMATYTNKNDKFAIEQTGILDWELQENFGAKEAFLAGISGEFLYNHIYIKDYFYYRHHAVDIIPLGGKEVEDNGVLAGSLGYKNKTTFDLLLDFQIGKIISWQAIRPAENKYSGGIYTELLAQYKPIGIKATYYNGDGTYLPLGDPLYRSGNYGRINLFLMFFDTDKVKAYFSFNTHFIDNEVNYSQQLSVKVRLEKE